MGFLAQMVLSFKVEAADGGYQATAYVTPLALMLKGGGRPLQDIRILKCVTACGPAEERF